MLTWIDRTHNLSPTGIGRYNREILERLPDSFHQVQPWKKIEVELMGQKFGGYVSRILLNVFSSFGTELAHAPGLFQLHRDCNTCMIHDYELIDNPEKMGIPKRLWQWHLESLHQLDAVICPSGLTAKETAKRGYVPVSDIHVIPHGIDTGTFFPAESNREERYVLCVGRYQERKCWKDIVEIQGLPDTVIRVGPPDAQQSENLEQKLSEKGVEFKDLCFVPDWQLRRLISGAEMLLHPSRKEGFGFTPLEAAACGTPSMVKNLEIYDETIEDYRVPWTTNYDDAKEQAEQCSSKELVNHIHENFSWEESVNRHIGIWKTLL